MTIQYSNTEGQYQKLKTNFPTKMRFYFNAWRVSTLMAATQCSVGETILGNLRCQRVLKVHTVLFPFLLRKVLFLWHYISVIQNVWKEAILTINSILYSYPWQIYDVKFPWDFAVVLFVCVHIVLSRLCTSGRYINFSCSVLPCINMVSKHFFRINWNMEICT